jgi:drug/metabolite transporter (DMT)-like permease
MLLLITVGIIHTGIAYLLYFTAIRHLSGQTIAVFSYIDPISAIILASIIFEEPMTFLQIIGGILILGATFLSEVSGRNKSSKEQAPDRI